ncbi:retrovirus-related Pol polyprotein from transposon 412 [Trichonephila clavipes]|nr:retrovirus-related Pol polyprotein from transposon 412 [Trichonephila clavipes]
MVIIKEDNLPSCHWLLGRINNIYPGKDSKVRVVEVKTTRAYLRDPSGLLARWALRLQEYDVSIVFKSGEKHADADCLSRNPIPIIPEIESFAAISDLATEQRDDPSLAAFIKACEQSPDLSRAGFSIVNNVLYKKFFDPSGKQWLPVVLKKMRLEILHHFHDEPTAGHLGFVRTYDRIRKRFFWSRLFRTVLRYVTHYR